MHKENINGKNKELTNHMCNIGTKIIEEDKEEIKYGLFQYMSFIKTVFVITLFILSWMIASRLIVMKKEYFLIQWINEFSQNTAVGYSGVAFIIILSLSWVAIDLARSLLQVLQNFIIDKKLFSDMINKLLNASIPLFFDKTSSGCILNKFTNDIDVWSQELSEAITNNIKEILMIVITIWIVAYNAFFWILIVPLSGILFIYTIREYVDSSKQIKNIWKIANSPIMTHINETIDGATTIRTFNKTFEFEDKHWQLQDNSYILDVIEKGLEWWLDLRLAFITIIFLSTSYIYCIMNRNENDSILVGLMMGYLIELQWSLHRIVNDVCKINSDVVWFDRWMKMLNIPQEADQHKPIPTDENNQPWLSKGHIKFNNYSVKYREDSEFVLKNLNIDIRPGEKIGIVGRTGAGKSTFCLSIWRILEALSGSIQIDGVDISLVGLTDLREKITIIPQEPILFRNTLRFNLDPENKHTDEEIIQMLEKAWLQSLLIRDGNGLKFKISEKGSNLSAGEKALICICRAALRKNKVVLLDEATASIDVKTEATIQKLILEEFKDSTVLTVAHRLNTIMHSDKVIVMSYGEVMEFDSPHSLKSNSNSLFSKFLSKLA